MCLDFKLKFGITHNWKFYYITIRPAVLVWNTTTPLKTACESIQVQAVPWSTHHHTFVMSEFVSLLSSIHTIAPPCMLNWWVRCCAWTATNCHLLDPAVIAEGRAHSLARKNTKFAEFFTHTFSGETYFFQLIDQNWPAEEVGCNWHLCWPCLMSAGEAGTLVQRQNKHLSCTYLTPTPTLKGTNNTHHLFSIALVTWGCSHSSSLWKDFGELRLKNEKGNNSPLLISCVSERYETGLKPHFSITDCRSTHNTITQSDFRGRPERTSLPYDSHNAYSISPNLSTMSAILDSQSMRETGAQIWNHTYFTISWHVSQRFMTAPPPQFPEFDLFSEPGNLLKKYISFEFRITIDASTSLFCGFCCVSSSIL